MKELKKLTTFQDKAARGAKPKGFSEAWAVMVSRHMHSWLHVLLPPCTFVLTMLTTFTDRVINYLTTITLTTRAFVCSYTIGSR